MLSITVPASDLFDEATNEFIGISEDVYLELENSLVAISRWEKKFKKPYFPKKNPNPYSKQKQEERTEEELRYFIKCMITNIKFEQIDDKILYSLTENNFNEIVEYLKDTQSATVLPEDNSKSKGKNRTVTSEVLYAWMTELQIPWEAQYWNINRLMNLIQIVNEDNAPPDKKKKRASAYNRMKNWDNINQQRLEQLGTKG